jgi:hypothetical protein
MSELRKHFERLMAFAKQSDFRKPFSQVYFVENRKINHSNNSEIADEISRRDIISFEDYEDRFNEILNQGHSWVNLSFAGTMDDALLIVVELPNYKNTVLFEWVSVNPSLPEKRVVENDWNISPFMKII